MIVHPEILTAALIGDTFAHVFDNVV